MSSSVSPNADAPPFVLRLFGPFAASVGGLPLPRLRSRKEQHLLCLLALHAPRPAERVWLAGLLWPESTEDAALSNLRRSLHLLRAALGKEHGARLHSPTPATLALDLTGADVDILAFDAALKSGTPDALETALALCARPLLEDCTEDWALTERAARQEAGLAACEVCGTECAAAGDHTRAARLLRRALSLDPLRETTVRGLMHSLAQSGDTAGAMDTFRRFRRRLRRELDAAPAHETRALLGQITDALSPVPALSACLPRPLTPLIGRRQEVRETVAVLDTSRLVTLSGTGGVGKTRLAIATAEDLSEETEVCFVALAALTNAAPLAAVVARALEITEACDTPDALVGHLRARPLLLVLDNCEHMIDTCAAFACALLERCPRLRVLATSRQPLGLPGEAVRPVPLLSVPSSPDTSRPATEYEAVQLFVARAQAVRASFSPDPRTLPAVVRICRRLDGLPLALELAAARVRSLSCEQIARKLDDRFSLLAGGNRGALPRHQTLRAAVDWSYDLLTEAERLLLCRLSVFVGGWTAEAAEAICEENNTDVLEALAGLVDKSLVQMQETEDGAARYFLLETLREYGQEKLEQAGQADALRARHREWFLTWVVDAELLLHGPEQGVWLARMDADHDNICATLLWRADEDALRLAGVFWWVWYVRARFSEGCALLDRLLRDTAHLPQTAARARAVSGAGAMASCQGDIPAARAFQEESLAIARAVGHARGIAASLNNLGFTAMLQGDAHAARAYHEESLALRRTLEDEWGIANSLANLATATRELGDYASACRLHREGLNRFRSLGDNSSIATCLLGQGITSQHMGERDAANDAYQEALALYKELGDDSNVAHALGCVGSLALADGDGARARACFMDSLTRHRKLGDRRGTVNLLHQFGLWNAAQQQPARAAVLFGAAEALWGETHFPETMPDQRQRAAQVQMVLGAEAFAAACDAGRVLTLDEAVTFALQEEHFAAPLPREAQSAGRAR